MVTTRVFGELTPSATTRLRPRPGKYRLINCGLSVHAYPGRRSSLALSLPTRWERRLVPFSRLSFHEAHPQVYWVGSRPSRVTHSQCGCANSGVADVATAQCALALVLLTTGAVDDGEVKQAVVTIPK